MPHLSFTWRRLHPRFSRNKCSIKRIKIKDRCVRPYINIYFIYGCVQLRRCLTNTWLLLLDIRYNENEWDLNYIKFEKRWCKYKNWNGEILEYYEKFQGSNKILELLMSHSILRKQVQENIEWKIFLCGIFKAYFETYKRYFCVNIWFGNNFKIFCR